jgi:hypothetical protein
MRETHRCLFGVKDPSCLQYAKVLIVDEIRSVTVPSHFQKPLNIRKIHLIKIPTS